MYQLCSPRALIGAALLCAAFYLAIVSHGRWLGRNRLLRLPPGPKPLPIVGNVHQVPAEYQEKTFARWSKEYGNLIYATMFTRPILIINTQKIARELLDKRGNRYSSRPRMVMLTELLGWDPDVITLPYNSEHRRKQRRWIQNAFGDKAAVRQFEKLQQRETYILLSALIHEPHDFTKHTSRYITALIMDSVYGHKVTSSDDPYIHIIDRAMELTTAMGPSGGTTVDFFPIVKHFPTWLPGMSWKRKVLDARTIITDAKLKPYYMARNAVVAGCAKPSIISTLIEDAMKTGSLAEEEPDIISACAAMYAAGTDTVKTLLLTLLLAMVLHPDAYQKAQDEVDRVIGRDRLPTLADREALPYVECVLKEVYRWNPPTPLSIPHYLTENDEYQGLDLPSDTWVIANLWSMSHSEEVYGDPDVFRPERFSDQSRPLNAEIADPVNIVFGHGRRICPGRLFADTAAFLAISNIIATLDIKKARDLQGREITPEARFVPGLVSHPREFACSITPRSAKAVQLVADAVGSSS
ncbi:cytochrome P450 [Fomitopsis serialis]|uniref:cytochrome P450 n=1 Tax=Fomitopsis serialis TaxID=139415 RepID=UPI00200733E8|nr:cytochrome P450 [Neoantrodia serialis]KAH9929386.1 cytochrome P450 [Neoantrodia serialis]